MDEIQNLLEKAIKTEIENLSALETGSDEKKSAIEGLEKLYKLRLEETEKQEEVQAKKDQREVELKQLDHEKKAVLIKTFVSGAELVLPLIFYAHWMRKGFKFEETGTFSSATFKGLINRFRPTKR